MKKALIVIDFINEIVSTEGKLATKGYSAFIAENGTFGHLNTAIGAFRKSVDPVIFVRLAFNSDYSNQPKGSPVFGKANEFGILADGTWSSEINDAVDYRKGDDEVVVKSRVNAFHATELQELLSNQGITDVYIAGVATDLAVEAAARAAHDLDFNVHVVSDACAAANQEDQEKSLRFLPKIAKLVKAEDL
jgi:nicotinamidase-related amidase